MLTLHGRATSSNVQAVMWAMAELGLSADRLDVGGAFGGNEDPAFLALNPMGRIPVLQDGDLTLFESQAILRYLAGRYNVLDLWPTDPVQRAPIDQWMEWAKVNVYPVMTHKVFLHLVRTSKAERDEAVLAAGIAELGHLMTIAEVQIARAGWIAGPEMTLADIPFATQLYRYYTMDIERADLPHLRRYYNRLCARPAYATHVMVSYEDLRAEGA